MGWPAGASRLKGWIIMSLLFTVTPVIAGVAWPILASLISKTLNNAGYNAIKEETDEAEKEKTKTEVDLELKNSEGLGETMGVEEKLVMQKNGITLTFS